MSQTFGEDGFGLYRMPIGEQIEPEEFSEFHGAYQALSNTLKFKMDMQESIERSQKPIVFVEGITDVKYLQKASELLGRQTLLDKIELKDGNGSELRRMWKAAKTLPDDILHHKIVFLFDCDAKEEPDQKGMFFKNSIPFHAGNPIKKGVENLFTSSTLSNAMAANTAFINVEEAHSKTERGESVTVPEQWTVNKDEKPNLCNWLCQYGTREDFQNFEKVFELLEGILHSQ